MATPIDFSAMGTFGSVLDEGRVDPEDLLDATGNVPAEVIRNGFRMAKPVVNVTEYVNLWQHLWDDDYLDAHRVMTGWARDHIPFPGAAFVQTIELFRRGNALAVGRVPLRSGEVDLADIDVPFNNIIGDNDWIVPPESSTPLTALVGTGENTETHLRAGHVGLVVGRTAQRHNIPAMASWIEGHLEER